MIIVYPVLVSRAVSEISIPAIAKTLENYIIVHKQDALISSANQYKKVGLFGSLRKVGQELMIKENDDISLEETTGIPPGSEPGTKMYDEEAKRLSKEWDDLFKKEEEVKKAIKDLESKQRMIDNKEEKDKLEREKFLYQKKKDEIKIKMDRIKDFELKLEREREKEERKENERQEKKEQAEKNAKNARVDVRVGDTKSISLDPTFINISHYDKDGNMSAHFLGVKVVPIRVRSDVKLSHLLLVDSQLNAILSLMVRLGRNVTRSIVHNLWDRWMRIFRDLTPSGDPRRDIIMGRTGMGNKSDTFIILSKQEDVDEHFLDNIPRINRLFKMGWSNFVIADDINRVANFCMKDLRGMCASVPYSIMYQHLGHGKAYESMEDAKRANASIFKISKRLSKVIADWKVTQKLFKFSQLNEGNKNE